MESSEGWRAGVEARIGCLCPAGMRPLEDVVFGGEPAGGCGGSCSGQGGPRHAQYVLPGEGD
eukprot:3491252-Pyramimonas_sp.AAC.1